MRWEETSVCLSWGRISCPQPSLSNLPHLLSWWVVTIALYRKRTPPQSLAHREDERDKAAALHTTHLIIAAFPDSRLSRFPGERGGGWEGRGTKTKLRKKLGQSSWGHIVPLWSDFALCCSYAAFRNTAEAFEFGHAMLDFLQEACLFRETMYTPRSSKLQEALFQGEPYFQHSHLHHTPWWRRILSATTQFVLCCFAVKLTTSHFKSPVMHCKFVSPDTRILCCI